MFARTLAAVLVLLATAAAAAKPGLRSDVSYYVLEGKKTPLPVEAILIDKEGLAQLARGEYALAEKTFTRSLALAPGNPRALANRGLCRARLGRPNDALADFEFAGNLEEAVGEALAKETAQARVKVGRELVDQGRPADAEKLFRGALMSDSKNAQAYSELAYLALQKNDYKECLALGTKAIEADRKFSDGYANRGACRFRSGETALGLKDIERAVKLSPSHAPFHASRAGMLWNLDRRDEARRAAERAVKLDPSLADALSPILGPR